MTTARLRKAFRFSEEDDDGVEMDEEEQERLIADLQQQDAYKNDLYRKAFLVIPLSAAIFFVVSLLVASKARQRLVSLLATSSLLCTAYVLHYLPLRPQDRKGKKPVYLAEAEKSPVESYLILLNASLAGLLLVSACTNMQRHAATDAWRETLPAMILGLTLFVRWQLQPLDLEELHSARYEYKGA